MLFDQLHSDVRYRGLIRRKMGSIRGHRDGGLTAITPPLEPPDLDFNSASPLRVADIHPSASSATQPE